MPHRACLFLTIVFVILFGLIASPQAQSLPLVRIGVVVDGPWENNRAVQELFRNEILEITSGEFDVQFAAEKTIEAGWTIESVRTAVDQLLNDPNVDILITLGVLATHDACRRRNLSKPVIAPIVIDARLQELPSANGASGVKNLNYIVFPNNILRDLRTFLDVVPFRKIAILVNKNIVEAIPNIGQLFANIVAELDVEPVVYAVDQSATDIVDEFPGDIEAVYVAPLIHLPPGEFEALIAGLIDKKLPSFSLFGKLDIERGILAGGNEDIFPRLARRVALNIQRILLGESAESLPTAFSPTEGLMINMATARLINVYPSWATLTEAELINERVRRVERFITMSDVVDEAIDANLDLAIQQKIVAAGKQDVTLARSALLPQIDLSLLGLQIDEDRGSAIQTEKTVSGTASLSQIIFSEPAWANLSIQSHLQNNLEYERDVLELDIAQQAATTYLNVLRANTFERIQKENVRRTRSNLDLARMREAIGTARSAEVLRWESELANNRNAVISANADRNVAEIALNQLLNRSPEEDFTTEEVDLTDSRLLFSQSRILQYMNNPWDFRLVRSFMAAHALAQTPEIQAVDAAISAQERGLASATRAFWIPQLGLEADVTKAFSRDGTGVTAFGPDDLNWQIGVSATYSLFSGGAKFATRNQAVETLASLRLQKASVSRLVEQRVHSAFHRTGAAYAGIEQSRLAAEAADKSLELVEDAYSRGAATILDLLDAQNNALIAEEVAANSIYDFLIDLMEAERASGVMVLRMSDSERQTFFDQLDQHFLQNRPSGNQ